VFLKGICSSHLVFLKLIWRSHCGVSEGYLVLSHVVSEGYLELSRGVSEGYLEISRRCL
jgi:hypothetical protein